MEVVNLDKCRDAVIRYRLVAELAPMKILGLKYEGAEACLSIIAEHRRKAISAAAKAGWLNGVIVHVPYNAIREPIAFVDTNTSSEPVLVYRSGEAEPLSDILDLLDNDEYYGAELRLPEGGPTDLSPDATTAHTMLVKAGLMRPRDEAA